MIRSYLLVLVSMHPFNCSIKLQAVEMAVIVGPIVRGVVEDSLSHDFQPYSSINQSTGACAQ